MWTLPAQQSDEELSSEIRNSALNRQRLKIRYRASDQKVTERTVEPYEVKNGKLFAYCTDKGGIRAFTIPNIEAAVETDTSYSPLYPIRINETTYIK